MGSAVAMVSWPAPGCGLRSRAGGPLALGDQTELNREASDVLIEQAARRAYYKRCGYGKRTMTGPTCPIGVPTSTAAGNPIIPMAARCSDQPASAKHTLRE
jgi:hypothetical protein